MVTKHSECVYLYSILLDIQSIHKNVEKVKVI